MSKQPSGFTVIPWAKHELIGMAWLVGTFGLTLAYTIGYIVGLP
jgi:hypothetical protein